MVASLAGYRFSLVSGGILCVAAVGVVCAALPAFTGYVAAPPAADAVAKSGSIA